MSEAIDCTDEYNKKTRPEIDKCIKNIVVSGIGGVSLTFFASCILKYFNLSDMFMPFIFFLCLLPFLYHLYSLRYINCPNCHKPLLILLGSAKTAIITTTYIRNNCPHCGAKLR